MAREELAATFMISLLVVLRVTSSSTPDDIEVAGPSQDDPHKDQPSWEDLDFESDEFNFDLAPRIPNVFSETTVSPITTKDISGFERTTTTDEISLTPTGETPDKTFTTPATAVLTDKNLTTVSYTSSGVLFPMKKSSTEVIKKNSSMDSTKDPEDSMAETDKDFSVGADMSTTEVTGDSSTKVTSVRSTVETDSSSSRVTDKISTVMLTTSSTDSRDDSLTTVLAIDDNSPVLMTDKTTVVPDKTVNFFVDTTVSSDVVQTTTTTRGITAMEVGKQDHDDHMIFSTAEGTTENVSTVATEGDQTTKLTSRTISEASDSSTGLIPNSTVTLPDAQSDTGGTVSPSTQHKNFWLLALREWLRKLVVSHTETQPDGTTQRSSVPEDMWSNYTETPSTTPSRNESLEEFVPTDSPYRTLSDENESGGTILEYSTEINNHKKVLADSTMGITLSVNDTGTVSTEATTGNYTDHTEKPTMHASTDDSASQTIGSLAEKTFDSTQVALENRTKFETLPNATVMTVAPENDTSVYLNETSISPVSVEDKFGVENVTGIQVFTGAKTESTTSYYLRSIGINDTQTAEHLDENVTDVSVTQKGEVYSSVYSGTTSFGIQTENIIGDVSNSTYETQSELGEVSTPLISSSSLADDTDFHTSVKEQTRDEEAILERDATTLGFTMEDRTQSRIDSELDASQGTPYKSSTTLTWNLANATSTFGTQTTDSTAQSSTVHADTATLLPAIDSSEAGYTEHSAKRTTSPYARIFTFPSDSSTYVSDGTGADTHSPDNITITDNVTDYLTSKDTNLSSTVGPLQKTIVTGFEGTHTQSVTDDVFSRLQTEKVTSILNTTDTTVTYSAPTDTAVSTAHTEVITETFFTEQLPDTAANVTEKDATHLFTHEERNSTITSGKLTEETTDEDSHFPTFLALSTTSHKHSFTGDTEPRTGHTPPYSETYSSPDGTAFTKSSTVTTPKTYSGSTRTDTNTTDTDEFPSTTRGEELETSTSHKSRYQPYSSTTPKEQHASTTTEYDSDTSGEVYHTITVPEIYYTSSTREATYGLVGISPSSESDRAETTVLKVTQRSPTIDDRTTASGSDAESTPTTERPLPETTSFKDITTSYLSLGETESTEDDGRPKKSHCPEDYPETTVATTVMETTNLTKVVMGSAVTVVLRLSVPQISVLEIREILRRAFQVAILLAVNNSDISRTKTLKEESDRPTTQLSLVFLNTSRQEIKELLILTFLIVQQDADADLNPLSSQTVLKIIEHSRVDLQEMLCSNLSSWFAGTAFWTVDAEDDVRSDDRGYFGLRRIMGKYEALFLVLTVSASSCLLVLVLGLIWTRYRRKANSKYQVDQDKLEARQQDHRRCRELTGCDLRPACEILREEKPYPPPEDDCWVVPLGQLSYNQDEIPPYLNDTNL